MVTKRNKIKAFLFEMICIWPIVVFTAVTLAVMFVASSPIILYYIVKKKLAERK